MSHSEIDIASVELPSEIEAQLPTSVEIPSMYAWKWRALAHGELNNLYEVNILEQELGYIAVENFSPRDVGPTSLEQDPEREVTFQSVEDRKIHRITENVPFSLYFPDNVVTAERVELSNPKHYRYGIHDLSATIHEPADFLRGMILRRSHVANYDDWVFRRTAVPEGYYRKPADYSRIFSADPSLLVTIAGLLTDTADGKIGRITPAKVLGNRAVACHIAPAPSPQNISLGGIIDTSAAYGLDSPETQIAAYGYRQAMVQQPLSDVAIAANQLLTLSKSLNEIEF